MAARLAALLACATLMLTQSLPAACSSEAYSEEQVEEFLMNTLTHSTRSEPEHEESEDTILDQQAVSQVQEAKLHVSIKQQQPEPKPKILSWADIDTSSTCSFFLLDIQSLRVNLEGNNTCDEGEYAADPLTGRVVFNPYAIANMSAPAPPGHDWLYPFNVWPQRFSQKAGPWYMTMALMSHPKHTERLEDAELIIIYDYCFLMRAMAENHAHGHWWLGMQGNYKGGYDGQKVLFKSWQSLAMSTLWQRERGRNFAFFHPLGDFNFGGGEGISTYYKMFCTWFRHSAWIMSEQMQLNHCLDNWDRSNSVIVPASVQHGREELAEYRALDQPRNMLVFSRGRCMPSDRPGRVMRHFVTRALISRSKDKTDAQCTTADLKGEGERGSHRNIPHIDLLKRMAGSVFTIVVPGDTQSSNQLTDAFLTGTIPVFVGPPFHAMPWAAEIPYHKLAIIIYIKRHARWLPGRFRWAIDVPDAVKPGRRVDERWWFPEVKRSYISNVSRPADIVDLLKNVSSAQITDMQTGLAQHVRYFDYRTDPTSPPSAAQLPLEAACRWVRSDTSTAASFELYDQPFHRLRDEL